MCIFVVRSFSTYQTSETIVKDAKRTLKCIVPYLMSYRNASRSIKNSP
jgi:hypothetical protein